MSWNDAVEFCKKLTSSAWAAGRLSTGIEYRLPSEAQWEYACRAGTTGDFAGELNVMAWYDSNSGSKTHEVKTKQPNAWGLYDMRGNVWEWCADWHGDYSPGAQVDPIGASSGAGRVFRGGSWGYDRRRCRSAYLSGGTPEDRNAILGFRLAAVPSSGSLATSGVGVERTEAKNEREAEAAMNAPAEITDGTKAGEEREIEVAQRTKITVCWLPPGTFTMGSPASEAGRSNDETQVQVRISRGFWLAKYECIQKTWRDVMGNNPSHFRGDSLPVDSVSWDDCQKFIGRLRSPNPAWRFSLPSEAQWEYACRAGTTLSYAGALELVGWYDLNSGGKTHSIGQRIGNAWGLRDMHGNVFEWCSDRCSEKLSAYPAQMATDPTGSGTGTFRICRGGSWYRDASRCRSAFRQACPPDFRDDSLGFRLALIPSDQTRNEPVQKSAIESNPGRSVNNAQSEEERRAELPVRRAEPVGELTSTAKPAGETQLGDSGNVPVALARPTERLKIVNVKIGDVLNLRAAANQNSRIVATIPPDADDIIPLALGVPNGSDIWIRARFGDKEGYVNSKHVIRVKDAVRP